MDGAPDSHVVHILYMQIKNCAHIKIEITLKGLTVAQFEGTQQGKQDSGSMKQLFLCCPLSGSRDEGWSPAHFFLFHQSGPQCDDTDFIKVCLP